MIEEDVPRRASLQDIELLDEGGHVRGAPGKTSTRSTLARIWPWAATACAVVLFVAVLVQAGRCGKGQDCITSGGGGISNGGSGSGGSISTILEEFMKVPTSEQSRAHLKYYTAEAHIAGSPRDYDTAVWTRDRWLEYGIPQVDIVPYDVLLSYPLSRSVSVVSPTPYNASLTEDAYPEDPTSGLASNIPTFHGYSASGNVTGPLVYANYGRDVDFAALKAAGISVEGCVVIVRYGKIYRGNKVGLAEANGAVGVLIYSDPADDGAKQGQAYPKGPWRPKTGVQRGSVYNGEGDPLTPGWSAVPGAFRKTIEQARDPAQTMPGFELGTIPSQPLSWGDAQPMLEMLKGTVATTLAADWQGGLNFTYRIGVGKAGPVADEVVCNINNKMNFTVTPIWNVIGTIPGSTEADRAVVIGNHRDAWDEGSVDPSSGSTVLMEIARGFGELVSKQKWQPRRSIVLASWDAEEYGLVGSTEWVEHRSHQLGLSAVAYLNLDTAVTGEGSLKIGGTPQLSDLAYHVAALLPQPKISRSKDPQTNLGTVYDYWLSVQRQKDPSVSVPFIDGLGAGSDFAPFLAFAGISSQDIEFGGDPDYYEGVYHSNYDSFYWMENFGDPTFEFHATLAKYTGALAIRLASDGVLPFNMTAYGVAMQQYTDDLARNVPSLDVGRVRKAVTKFRSAATSIDTAAAAVTKDTSDLAVRAINDRMMQCERALLVREGLPGRPWFKHAVYSPSLYNSYGSEKFPGVYDAIAQGQQQTALEQVAQVARSIEAAADVLQGYVWNS